MKQKVAAGRAQPDGRHDAPMNGAGQFAPANLSKVRETDGDNQEGFNPFPRGDDEGLECLKHEPDVWENETQSQNVASVYLLDIRPVKSAIPRRPSAFHKRP